MWSYLLRLSEGVRLCMYECVRMRPPRPSHQRLCSLQSFFPSVSYHPCLKYSTLLTIRSQELVRAAEPWDQPTKERRVRTKRPSSLPETAAQRLRLLESDPWIKASLNCFLFHAACTESPGRLSHPHLSNTHRPGVNARLCFLYLILQPHKQLLKDV